MESVHTHRKREHLSLAEKQYATTHATKIFDAVRLLPTTLPEMAVTEVNLVPSRIGWNLEWPFYIEAMTGGNQTSTKINAALARQARKHHLAMALGSMSIMLKEPATRKSFAVCRQENPDGFLIANLGAKAKLKEIQEVINFIGANALEIHVNAAQEIIMAEGDRNFHWIDHLASILAEVTVPVIIKEVGFGMTAATIHQLETLGAHWINISGRGGTNFALIENRRNHHENFTDLHNWGLTTPESLLEAQNHLATTRIIASGGITSPLDVVKAGVLGADAVGVAGYFLHRFIQDGEEGLDATLTQWQTELPRLFTLIGAKNWASLTQVEHVFSPDLLAYWQQRQPKIQKLNFNEV